jgi:hypothetical protein
MHWSAWLTISGWTIAIFASLVDRRWRDAAAFACLAVFAFFDKFLPAALPWQLKYSFFVIGAVLIAISIARNVRRYKARRA